MKKKSFITALTFVLMVNLFLMGACSADKQEDTSNDADSLKGEITLAAAASLENTMVDELIPLFKKTNPDVTFVDTYDGSGKLQEQIEGGFKAGVFMSAATKQMDALIDGGFVDEKNVANVLKNEVVLIKSVESDTPVDSFSSIEKAKMIAIGDPESVPAGQYAKEILENMKLWDKVESELSMGTNVTQVLNWVAEGNAEVGIVYKTDAMSMTDKVTVIESASDEYLKSPVIYPIGMLNSVDEANMDATKAFFEFLQSNEALAIFEKSGFTVVK